MAANPERAARFAAGMRLYASRSDLDVRCLVKAWPWGKPHEGAAVVNVSGSHGEAAIALARASPLFTFVFRDINEPRSLKRIRASPLTSLTACVI